MLPTISSATADGAEGNVGRYVLGQALVFGLSAQPGYNLQLTSSRAWVDNNKNFVPDCDLSNRRRRVRRRPEAISNRHVQRSGRVNAISTTTNCVRIWLFNPTRATGGASGRTAGNRQSVRSMS